MNYASDFGSHLDAAMSAGHKCGMKRNLTRGAVLLREIVETRKLSQAEVAEKIGVGQPMISDYLRAKKLPGRGVARRFFVVFAVPTGSWDEPVLADEARKYFGRGAPKRISGVHKARACKSAAKHA